MAPEVIFFQERIDAEEQELSFWQVRADYVWNLSASDTIGLHQAFIRLTDKQFNWTTEYRPSLLAKHAFSLDRFLFNFKSEIEFRIFMDEPQRETYRFRNALDLSFDELGAQGLYLSEEPFYETGDTSSGFKENRFFLGYKLQNFDEYRPTLALGLRSLRDKSSFSHHLILLFKLNL